MAAPEFPAFTAPVVDAADAIPEADEKALDDALLDYQNRSDNQVAVAVVRTTGGISIEEYSLTLANMWKVGQGGRNNGAVLVVALDDRKLRIEVGSGIEDVLTDAEAAAIIESDLVPLLRAGNVGAAVRRATESMRRELGDKTVGTPAPLGGTPAGDGDSGGGGAGGAIGGIILLLALIGGGIFLLTRKSRGAKIGGGALLAGAGALLLGSLLRGGRGGGDGDGGGGFSGGFGGGGGGDFGGGGASGSW